MTNTVLNSIRAGQELLGVKFPNDRGEMVRSLILHDAELPDGQLLDNGSEHTIVVRKADQVYDDFNRRTSSLIPEVVVVLNESSTTRDVEMDIFSLGDDLSEHPEHLRGIIAAAIKAKNIEAERVHLRELPTLPDGLLTSLGVHQEIIELATAA
ncbi:MAG TPA: hypothetical protein VLF63_03455 [Patescibacteria group bacterium]|nr:hypothetical protein [Patescibacteria group bacterium]